MCVWVCVGGGGWRGRGLGEGGAIILKGAGPTYPLPVGGR